MRRRTFLRMLGIAPVAAAVPAMALPRPENVKNIVTGEAGPELVINPEISKPLIYQDGRFWINPANIGPINTGTLRTRNGIEYDAQTRGWKLPS